MTRMFLKDAQGKSRPEHWGSKLRFRIDHGPAVTAVSAEAHLQA